MNRVSPHRVVIAVDGSENSRRAVAYVGGLLGGLSGFEVTLLNVIHAPEVDFFSSSENRDRWIETSRKKTERWLAGYREMLIGAGINPGDVTIRTAQRDGPSLARLILDELAAMNAETIVVGRQGLSPKEEFLFGSVSRQIVSHVRNCTVWVVQ
jgi:nucleotide-binding universal stress UspA family protein